MNTLIPQTGITEELIEDFDVSELQIKRMKSINNELFFVYDEDTIDCMLHNQDKKASDLMYKVTCVYPEGCDYDYNPLYEFYKNKKLGDRGYMGIKSKYDYSIYYFVININNKPLDNFKEIAKIYYK